MCSVYTAEGRVGTLVAAVNLEDICPFHVRSLMNMVEKTVEGIFVGISDQGGRVRHVCTDPAVFGASFKKSWIEGAATSVWIAGKL